MKKGMFVVIGAGGLGLFGTAAAHAHGSEEIEIFAYLLEEEGFFRIVAGLVGVVFALLGLYITWNGNSVWGEMIKSGETHGTSRTKMIAPGLGFVGISAAIIFAAIFILPNKVDVGGHHPDIEVKIPEKK